MPSASPIETAALIRAARGYSGLTQIEMAGEMALSVETMSRIENGRREATESEIARIAQVCEVPPLFFETGFRLIEERGAEPTQAAVLKRLAALESQVRDLARGQLVRDREALLRTGEGRRQDDRSLQQRQP